MKTLILGAKGMLGQDLARVFSDHDLVRWDREDIDITDKIQVQGKIRALRPNLIINAAAYNAVDDCEVNIEPALKVNAHGPDYLARIANELGLILVHYSSDYVFDGKKREGYAESDAPDPISAYGYTKRQGERNVLANCYSCYVIRLSRLFGRPAAAVNAKKSFVDTMISLARDRNELKVVNEEWSNPTYTMDLAARTKELVMDSYPYGLYHITNRGACNWFEFAHEIFRLTKTPVNLIPVPAADYPRPALRPAHSSLLNTKAPGMRTWQEALAEYLNVA